jgi:hypothetical protein
VRQSLRACLPERPSGFDSPQRWVHQRPPMLILSSRCPDDPAKRSLGASFAVGADERRTRQRSKLPHKSV